MKKHGKSGKHFKVIVTELFTELKLNKNVLYLSQCPVSQIYR